MNIKHKGLLCLFFSVLYFVHWLWKYGDCQSVWFSWTPRRTADNRTGKKIQVLGLSCVKWAGFPTFFTGIWQNWIDCSPMNMNLILFTMKCFSLTDTAVVVFTRGSPSFTIWFMEKSCASIKSQFASTEPSWLKPFRGVLTLVRSCWNLSLPKSVSQATGRTLFPRWTCRSAQDCGPPGTPQGSWTHLALRWDACPNCGQYSPTRNLKILSKFRDTQTVLEAFTSYC